MVLSVVLADAKSRISGAFLWIALLISVAAIPAVAMPDTVYVPGRAYFGRNQYIEYDAGELPIVLTSPHGGHELPEEIPDRTWGTTSYDTNTQELLRELTAALFRRTGKYPHVIFNRLHRKKLDANREVVEAAQGNPYAIQAWGEYHAFIGAARQAVLRSAGKGLYVDIHGHGHAVQRAELGYLLTSGELALSDDSLNLPRIAASSSIRTLAGLRPGGLAGLLHGPHALGTFLEDGGYPAVPSATQHSPGSDPYFTGGYNTERYGSVNGGTIDGVQIELNSTGVRDTEVNYKRFAEVCAGVLDDYVQVQYFGRPTSAREEPPVVTGAWTLEQNYPNPFNPSTKIRFCVPAGQAGGWVGTADGRWVRLQVFDLLGRDVVTLVNERKNPGPYVVTFDAAGLPGGVYLYRFSAGATTISRTMVLLR